MPFFDNFWRQETLLTIVSLLFLLSGCHADKQSNYPPETITKSNQEFTFNLYKKVVQSETGNICLSPFSVSFCLGMIMNGTEGDTYDEIRQLMGFQDFTREDINRYMQTIRKELSTADTSVTIINANSIWINNRFNVRKAFTRLNKKYYQAETYNEPFDSNTISKINQWSADHTNGKITKPVQQIDNKFLSILINSIYFKGRWSDEFRKSATIDEPFLTADSCLINTPTMIKKHYINSYRDEKVTVAELPYGNETFSMVLFLPTQKDGDINEIIAHLDKEQWEGWLNNLSLHKFELHLPRFKMEQKINLEKQLKALGIKKAFIASLDFAQMCQTEKFYIHSLSQNSFIEVNEEGTEAVATTVASIIAEEEIASNFPAIIRFDRPFGYMIKEKNSGVILFAGKVDNPEECFLNVKPE